jgi:hypothetical protein
MNVISIDIESFDRTDSVGHLECGVALALPFLFLNFAFYFIEKCLQAHVPTNTWLCWQHLLKI